MRSRIACAAASANPSARHTCRVPICSTRRATRSSPPRSSSRRFSTRSRRAAEWRIQHWDELADVADHCTVCHRCASPCPVDIDFGNVSMLLRDVLRRMGKKRCNLGTAAAMFFLNATNPQTIKLARKVMIDWGYKAQRLANRALQAARPRADAAAALDHGQAAGARASHPFREQADAGRLAASAPRARCSTSRTAITCPSFAIPRRPAATRRRCSTFRAAARSACSRRSDSRRRRCCGTSACRPCCRRAICAADTRSGARASSRRPKRSSPTTACCSIASQTRSITWTSRPWW